MNARHGSGRLAPNFAAKGIEIPRQHPFRRRRWFRALLLALGSAAGLAGAVALAFFNRWHDDRLADFERQRRCLDAFLRSPEFAAFSRRMDAHFIALNNWVAAQPRQAAALWPEIAQFERASGRVSWAVERMPLPASAAAEPGRVIELGRSLSAALAERGLVFEENARREARQLFLRLLVPHLRTFLQRAPENTLGTLFLDRTLQETALAGFAAQHGLGTSLHDSERLFALYVRAGRAMWEDYARERTAKLATVAGTSFDVRLSLPRR